ncbi:agrin-like [Littorina saxatilis]|uniref:CTCK domain-containing protein n=1 Tax=Littorina saxatilis TaxID=31220 RepID=A0AAN9G383_9CAEN
MTDDSLGQPKTTSCAVVTQTFTKARLSAPFIIDGAVRQWPARDWTVDKLADALGEKTFRCRLMPQEREVKGVPAWEAEGVYVNCQLCQFNSWCQGEASQDNPLAPFSPLHFSAYIDYKYMTQVFAQTPHMLGEDEPVTKWSDWSECDVKCGKGRTRRNRQRLRQTDLPLTQEASCYKLCNDGPCRPGTCNNPGQVCVVDGATGKGRCECPDCAGRPESPVCGLVGNVVRSFDNECKLRKGACELAKNFQLLENRACEEKPQNCSVTRNFAKLRDADGCVSAGDQDVGFCYGGCGDVPGKCCRPDTTATPQRSANLTYTCPDGSTRTKQEQVITACSCVAEPEQ